MTLPEDDDFLAGEYVLGTLDHSTRMAANLRRAADPAFDQAVEDWETRLTPLVETVPEINPPATVWPAIVARINDVGGNVSYALLNRQVTRWRRVAALSTGLAAALALWVGVTTYQGQAPTAGNLVAVLQKTNEVPAFVMRADVRGRALSVRPVAAEAVPGKSYELWVIDPAIGPPKSLGVIGAAAPSHSTLPDVPATVLSRATYAVTVEAPGGSASGAPTSAPILFGHFVATGS